MHVTPDQAEHHTARRAKRKALPDVADTVSEITDVKQASYGEFFALRTAFEYR